MVSRPLGADLLTAFCTLGLSSRRISAASPGGTPYMPAAPATGWRTRLARRPPPDGDRIALPSNLWMWSAIVR